MPSGEDVQHNFSLLEWWEEVFEMRDAKCWFLSPSSLDVQQAKTSLLVPFNRLNHWYLSLLSRVWRVLGCYRAWDNCLWFSICQVLPFSRPSAVDVQKAKTLWLKTSVNLTFQSTSWPLGGQRSWPSSQNILLSMKCQVMALAKFCRCAKSQEVLRRMTIHMMYKSLVISVFVQQRELIVSRVVVQGKMVAISGQ